MPRHCTGTPKNGCSGCGEDFGSVSLFDRHRVGVYEYAFAQGLKLDSSRDDGRRSLSIEEMIGKGWELDARGRWVDPVKVEQARRAFAKTA